jgi:hypothetical protein
MKIKPEINPIEAPKSSKQTKAKKGFGDKVLSFLGFVLKGNGIIIPINWFGRLICRMGVTDNSLQKIGKNKFKINREF